MKESLGYDEVDNYVEYCNYIIPPKIRLDGGTFQHFHTYPNENGKSTISMEENEVRSFYPRLKVAHKDIKLLLNIELSNPLNSKVIF